MPRGSAEFGWGVAAPGVKPSNCILIHWNVFKHGMNVKLSDACFLQGKIQARIKL